jgi:hypothetical protein
VNVLIATRETGINAKDWTIRRSESMKCLSLTQPWAWAVCAALKDVENRKWHTHYRGEILIHASKGYDKIGELVLRENGIIPPSSLELNYGGIQGKTIITDCVRVHTSKWFFGPWGFVLNGSMMFKEFIPWPGRLGLFEIPKEIIEEWRKEGLLQ